MKPGGREYNWVLPCLVKQSYSGSLDPQSSLEKRMNTPHCLYCELDDAHTPLIAFTFQTTTYWICPQHFPILIHKPEQLAEKLPGLIARPGDHAH
jgi:hypothetical protein